MSTDKPLQAVTLIPDASETLVKLLCETTSSYLYFVHILLAQGGKKKYNNKKREQNSVM